MPAMKGIRTVKVGKIWHVSYWVGDRRVLGTRTGGRLPARVSIVSARAGGRVRPPSSTSCRSAPVSRFPYGRTRIRPPTRHFKPPGLARAKCRSKSAAQNPYGRTRVRPPTRHFEPPGLARAKLRSESAARSPYGRTPARARQHRFHTRRRASPPSFLCLLQPPLPPGEEKGEGSWDLEPPLTEVQSVKARRSTTYDPRALQPRQNPVQGDACSRPRDDPRSTTYGHRSSNEAINKSSSSFLKSMIEATHAKFIGSANSIAPAAAKL